MSAGVRQASGYTSFDVVKAAAGTVVLALVLACVYGPADYYSPLVYLNAVLAGLMGWLIGRCGTVMLRLFRIDGRGAATLVAVAGALAGLWFGWLTYLWVLADFDFGVFGVFANPAELCDVMNYLSENPAWSISSRSGRASTTGPGLMYWGVWLVEGLVFLFVAVKECREFVTANKLCPQCREWLRATGDEAVFEVPADGLFMANIAVGDLTFLEKLPRFDAGLLEGEAAADRQWLTATSYACGRCEGLNAHVTLIQSMTKLDKKKKVQTATTVLANMVEISRELEAVLFHRSEMEAPAAAGISPEAEKMEKTDASAEEQRVFSLSQQ